MGPFAPLGIPAILAFALDPWLCAPIFRMSLPLSIGIFIGKLSYQHFCHVKPYTFEVIFVN
jgi:hypothetical protein